MSPPPALHPPKQERSRRTLERILEATRTLVAERGADETSVQQIVDRAGSSVGSFYARFDGKDALLDYLEQEVWREARVRWDEAFEERDWRQLDLSDLAAGVVQVLLDLGRYAPDVRRALRLRRGGGRGLGGEQEPEPARALADHVLRGLHELLLARAGVMNHPDPSTAVDVGVRAVIGGLRELEAWGELDDADLVAELSRLLLAYLGSDRYGRDPDAARMEFFDVWA